MRRILALLLASAGAGALAVGHAGAARAPKTLEIVHFVRGCHIFSTNHEPAVKVRLRTSDRIRLVDHDPMDFDIVQLAGPRVPVADPRLRRSEQRILVFRKAGLYRFRATNVQTSEELGLETLGPDNTLRIVVRVA